MRCTPWRAEQTRRRSWLEPGTPGRTGRLVHPAHRPERDLRPLSEAARFLVGCGRTCTVAQAGEQTKLELQVEPLEMGGGFWRKLIDRLEPELNRNRTTLIFANVRSTTERLGWLLTRRFPAWADAIGVHHSAMARNRRLEVEQRLKAGALRAVVSSASLELGIDIGRIDGVVLVHPPGCVVHCCSAWAVADMNRAAFAVVWCSPLRRPS